MPNRCWLLTYSHSGDKNNNTQTHKHILKKRFRKDAKSKYPKIFLHPGGGGNKTHTQKKPPSSPAPLHKGEGASASFHHDTSEFQNKAKEKERRARSSQDGTQRELRALPLIFQQPHPREEIDPCFRGCLGRPS